MWRACQVEQMNHWIHLNLTKMPKLTKIPEIYDAHNWKWRCCQTCGNFVASDKVVKQWCILFHLKIPSSETRADAVVFAISYLMRFLCSQGTPPASFWASLRKASGWHAPEFEPPSTRIQWNLIRYVFMLFCKLVSKDILNMQYAINVIEYLDMETI